MRRPGNITRLNRHWARFWMRFSGLGPVGRLSTRLAALFAPPHYDRAFLAKMHPHGYISPDATIYHSIIRLGTNVFVDDRCMIFENKGSGYVELGDNVRIYRDTIIETGQGGYLTVGAQASIFPRCQINAYQAPIHIGKGAMIAANCALFSYDHCIAPGIPIREQPLTTKGEIFIGDEAWIGTGSIILSGVRIGDGAVIGAGSVVTQSIPAGAIAVGNPARIVKMRTD